MILLRLFSRVSKISSLVLLIFISLDTRAQIISPSAEEVRFSYTTTFTIPVGADEQSDEDRAAFHASHIFGLFHSPQFVKMYDLPAYAGGIGGPRSQMNIKILSSEVEGDQIRIRYSNAGKMLLHKNVVAAIAGEGVMHLPMPTNPYAIYDQKCTDEHYTSFGDYWYFYDPFKKDCTYLSKPPYAVDVKIKITPTEYKKLETTLKLPQLRGDNGNGDLFSIYVIHGFESEPSDKNDEGRGNFKEFNQYLLKKGFKENKESANGSSSYFIYTKDLALDNGKKIKIEVKHLLITTDIGSKSKVFARFFKEAVETADVIMYGGHSGLGGNLDIHSLEEKAGAFHFNSSKKQIFFFDSCSSYSYYLQHFAVEKTKSKIDIISYGLSSYFQTSNGVLSALMDHLFSKRAADVLWKDVLHDMEKPLEGDTYLLNVGGL